MFPRVNGVRFSQKSLKSQKWPAEPIFSHFFAKVTIYYACNADFRLKWREIAQKCHLGAKVPFGAISVPGRVQKLNVYITTFGPGRHLGPF